MRRLIGSLVVLALLWTGYWFIAGFGVRQGVAGWFLAQEARGWQAEYATLSTTGFPLRHITTIASPALADPATGTAWQADSLVLESPAIWPGDQILRFAPTPQRLSYFDQTLVLNAADMVANLQLHPGVALELEAMALTAGPWRVDGDGGLVMGAEGLTLAMRQQDAAEVYTYNVSANGFTPGDTIRRVIRGSDDLPDSFETLELDMTVRFDRAWDRTALEDSRPQPREIDLRLAEAAWGALRLAAAGNLEVDAMGIPTGDITVKAENWRDMLAMAEASGALPPQIIDPVDRALSMLAGLGGSPDALDVQLNLRDGIVAVGPFPLGPAPRLILR